MRDVLFLGAIDVFMLIIVSLNLFDTLLLFSVEAKGKIQLEVEPYISVF